MRSPAPVGTLFGRWTVTGEAEPTASGARRWLCQCDCGTISSVMAANLKRGMSTGCYACRDETGPVRHGLSHTRLWRTWVNMIRRCYDPRNKSYPDYGGRGITVCDRWRWRVDEFALDMGQPPPGHSLDRIDNDKPYSPENCRWATRAEQNRNTRRNRYVELSDGRRVTVAELARESGIKRTCLLARIKRGVTGPDLVKPPRAC